MTKPNKLITAENASLNLPNGTFLALVSETGEIIHQGSDLAAQMFDAVKKQVVYQVFSNVKPLLRKPL